MDLDFKEDSAPDNLTLLGDLKKVQIEAEEFQTAQFGSGLTLDEELGIVQILRHDMDLFAWKPSDMSGIDPDIMCHQLPIDLNQKAVSQRK